MTSQGTLAETARRSRLTFTFGMRVSLAADHYCGFHDHPSFEIVYHAAGDGTTTASDGYQGGFVPGSVVIYPPNVIHDQQNRAAGTDICVHFAVDETPAILSKTVYIPHIARRPLVDEMTALADSRRTEGDLAALACDFRVTAVVLSLLDGNIAAEPVAEGDVRSSLAELAEEYIRSCYRTIESVGEIAQHLSVSEGYLRHVYKAAYGVGLRQRLVMARIERAQEMLTHSGLPIKEIAALCGFESEQYFAASFRRVVGRTAGSLRSEARQAQGRDLTVSRPTE